jgi:hypothetical protein
MGKRLGELDVRLKSSEIATLHSENEAYLRGQRPEPELDNVWAGWITVGKVMFVVGLIILALMLVVLGYFIIWNSSQAVEVEGVIDDFRSGDVYYHYTVNNIRYDAVEPAGGRSVSDWDNGNAPYPIVYLSFQPNVSHLKHNVAHFEWGTAIFVGIFLLAIPFVGLMQINFTKRMIMLREEATHIIEGNVSKTLPGQRGVVNYYYSAVSPMTGKQLSGVMPIGRLNPRYGRMKLGSHIAIIYKDDKTFTVL